MLTVRAVCDRDADLSGPCVDLYLEVRVARAHDRLTGRGEGRSVNVGVDLDGVHADRNVCAGPPTACGSHRPTRRRASRAASAVACVGYVAARSVRS